LYFLLIFAALDVTSLFYYTDGRMSVGIPTQENFYGKFF